MTKFLTGAAFAGAAMLACFTAAPANAQTPGGSYLQSCRDVQMRGDTLVAMCARGDGSWARTAFRDADSCRSGFANTNGRLTCGRRAGSEEQYGFDRDRRDRFEGYGSSYDRDSYRRGWRDEGYGRDDGYRQAPGYWYGR